MQVKRYRHVGTRMIETIEPNDGNWCQFSDVSALQKRCGELAKENRRLHAKYDDLVQHANAIGKDCGRIGDCGWCSTGHQ